MAWMSAITTEAASCSAEPEPLRALVSRTSGPPLTDDTRKAPATSSSMGTLLPGCWICRESFGLENWKPFWNARARRRGDLVTSSVMDVSRLVSVSLITAMVL
jgi:hypothetical protein